MFAVEGNAMKGKEEDWRSLWLLNVFLIDNIGVNSGTIMDI
jgi:hypothetical protein